MKNLIILVTAILLAMTPAVVSANLITDGDFEGSGQGTWLYWAGDSNFVENFDYGLLPANVYEGSQSLEISWDTAVPAWSSAVAWQEISVNEGDLLNASVYAKTVGLDGAAYLQTTFWNESGYVDQLDISLALTGDKPWQELTNSGEVPVGATFAKYRLVLEASATGTSGTVYFDDAVVPEPSSLLLLGVGLGGLLVFVRRKKA